MSQAQAAAMDQAEALRLLRKATEEVRPAAQQVTPHLVISPEWPLPPETAGSGAGARPRGRGRAVASRFVASSQPEPVECVAAGRGS